MHYYDRGEKHLTSSSPFISRESRVVFLLWQAFPLTGGSNLDWELESKEDKCWIKTRRLHSIIVQIRCWAHNRWGRRNKQCEDQSSMSACVYSPTPHVSPFSSNKLMIHNRSITLTALQNTEQCTLLNQGHTSITWKQAPCIEQGHTLNKQQQHKQPWGTCAHSYTHACTHTWLWTIDFSSHSIPYEQNGCSEHGLLFTFH